MKMDKTNATDGRASRHALLIVFLVVFIDLLGFGIVLPLLPLYADDILEPLFPGRSRAPLRGALLGLLMSSFSAMQFVFAPVWGRVSDRVGRRPVLLMGLAGSVIFYALFGIASDVGAHGSLRLALALLFVARIGAGVAGATISTAQAVIADCTTPERRARGMALIGAAFGIGFTFGPLLGFASMYFPLAGAPGYLAAVISLVAAVFAVACLPETLRQGSSYGRRSVFDWSASAQALRSPLVGPLILAFFLATLAFGGLESTLALVNKALWIGETELDVTGSAAKTTEKSNFLIFAYVGLVLMLVQGFLYRRLVQRVGEMRFARAGLILMFVGFVGAVGVLALRNQLESRETSFGFALAVMTVAVTGFAFVTPSVQSLISRRSDPTRQGEILGVNQSAAALARILGPLFGILLFSLTPSHVLPFVAGALLLVVVFWFTLRIPSDDPPVEHGSEP